VTRTADGRLRFEVSDTGIGIEPESQDAIFEAFTQTRSGAAAGGTGLGLTICRHLVRSMGDELAVESAPGRGSRFFFALPLVPLEPSAGDRQPDEQPGTPPLDARLEDGQHISALVVDDSTVSRRILASLLESAGVQVITAAGGLEAIASARQHRPDVIFMDLRMNDLNGFEATRLLRQDPATASIPVVAVTASAFGDTRQDAREAGCVGYLPKPVKAEALFATLRDHLGARFVAVAEPPAGVIELTSPMSFAAAEVAARLAEAIAIGSLTDLELVAEELMRGDEAAMALGRRVSRLASSFDFDGLRTLADLLSRGREGAGAGD
jgi:CheY-like chemotaxis protein